MKPKVYHYISPQALRTRCTQNADSYKFDPETVQPGDVLYAHSISQFLKHKRYRARGLAVPYTLVSSFHDAPVPGQWADLFAADPWIRTWASSNVTEPSHPRLLSVPLGIDGNWDRDLQRRQEHLRPAVERQTRCYINWRLSTHRIRREVDEWATTQSWITRSDRLSRPRFYDDLMQAQWVMSPPGYGMDCYRTWEALILGCYVIAVRSPLTVLYAGLPVVVVDDLRAVTPAMLTALARDWADRTWELERLTATFWWDRIADRMARAEAA